MPPDERTDGDVGIVALLDLSAELCPESVVYAEAGDRPFEQESVPEEGLFINEAPFYLSVRRPQRRDS
jgi:hypothetical protein